MAAPAEAIFKLLDDPLLLGKHMNQRSPTMAGGFMRTETDEQRGQQVGSVIRMSGHVLGLALWVEETVIERAPSNQKVWETKGHPRLLAIGCYRMGFDLRPVASGTDLRIWIDYSLPSTGALRWLSRWLAPVYADWCLRQLMQVVELAFKVESRL